MEYYESLASFGDKTKFATFADRAAYDDSRIREMLKPEPGEDLLSPDQGVRLEYLQDPVTWIEEYSEHLTEFTRDRDYLEYIEGLLQAVVNSSPYSGQDIYSPILLLNKFVTKRVLMECRDPMRTSLRLQSLLLKYAKIENDNNSIYDRSIEELDLIPREFAVSLMNACISPFEVIKLMRLDDDTMLQDVLESGNVDLVACKMYQKVVWQKFWGSELEGIITEKHARRGKYTQTIYVCKRVVIFLFWNIFYMPASLFGGDMSKLRKRRSVFFSPFSSYLADLLNYNLLVSFLLWVILTTVPDPGRAQANMEKLTGIREEEIDVDYRYSEDGSLMMRLPVPEIPLSEWLLWTAIFSRALTEFFQAYEKKGETLKEKLTGYFGSFYNVTDVFLLLFLFTGMASKLITFFRAWCFGIYVKIEDDPEIELVPHELIFTIYFYCSGAIVALVHLLQVYTIHIPGLGPLILAAKRTFVEVSGLIFIYLFVIAGFLIPIVGMMTCYRVVHGIDGVDDDNDFYYFASFGDAVVTLVWNMFGGLDVEHRANLHRSRDTVTTVFMVILLVLYSVILGLLCMNLVIAIIVDVYSKVTSDKYADWRFSQFESIIDYNGGSNQGDGMPFLFPMCIPFILYAIIFQPCREKSRQKDREGQTERETGNSFARFLCKHRLLKPPDT